MKKLALFITAILFTSITFAQDYSVEEVEIVQNLFGLEKKSIIEENIDFKDVDEASFWSLYNEYEVSRKELGKQKFELLQQYGSIKTITNEEVEMLMKKAIPLRNAEDALIEKYYKKVNKATNAIVAAQFYQIERYISDGIRFTLLNNMGFVQDKK